MIGLIPILIVGLVFKQVYDHNFSQKEDISNNNQILLECLDINERMIKYASLEQIKD